jgi:hypothetical protein
VGRHSGRKSRNHHPEPRPLRSRRGYWVDQVFLRRAGGRINATVALVNADNALRTERFFAPTNDATVAMQFVGREVAGLGIADDASHVRVRWAIDYAYDQGLVVDTTLEDVFINAFEAQLDIIRDQSR